MLIKSGEIPPIVIATPGRLGDLVTAEAIFRRAHDESPERPIILFTLKNFASVMEFCPYITQTIIAESKNDFENMEEKFPSGTTFIRINLYQKEKSAVKPLPEEASSWSLMQKFQFENGISPTNDFSKFYLKTQDRPADLPEKYIVFHCVSNGKSRQWRLANWKRLADFCIRSGMPVVEIGFGSVINSDSPDYYAKCGLQDLQDTATVIKHAQALVGVESGMLHIANALDVFGFIITGALRNIPEYNHYCGNYYIKKNCNFLRFYGVNSFDLPYNTVEYAVKAFLEGKPLTSEECDLWCYRNQIIGLQNRPAYRFFRPLRDMLQRIQMSYQFRQRPKRK